MPAGRPARTETEWVAYILDKATPKSNGCLDCHAPTNQKGYSYIQPGGRSGRKVGAHRFMYEQFYGPIPVGKIVMHACDNPRCIRPTHLQLGTYKENTQDMMQKGRHKFKIMNRVVTPELSESFKTMYAAGFTIKEIAEQHDVAYHNVWQHCTGGYDAHD